jgi:heavy metal sensor kinase
LLGLALFGAGTWIALQHRLIAGVDESLAQRVDGARTVIEIESKVGDHPDMRQELSEFAREVPNGTLIQVSDAAGRVLLPATSAALLPAPFPPGNFGYRTVERKGRSYRFLAARFTAAGNVYDALVAAPLDDVESVLRDFRNLLLMMIPGVLLAACLGGYWISRRALQPVDEITRVARSISVQNLSRRLAVPQTGDEIQRMSETWNEVLQRLETAVSRIRQFTADASHELRTPVALIRATAELALRRERDPEQYRHSLRDIQAEAERMTALTETLLSMARSDAGNAPMPLARGDVNALTCDAVRQNAARAEQRGIRLAADLAPAPALAAINETGVRRLLNVLIDNAIQYTPAGGEVTVSTEVCDGGVRLAVRDTGIGIAPEHLPQIFERFYRADPARPGGGVGLGLSIARLIAQAHGSEIQVQSAPGQGSQFSVMLHA